MAESQGHISSGLSNRSKSIPRYEYDRSRTRAKRTRATGRLASNAFLLEPMAADCTCKRADRNLTPKQLDCGQELSEEGTRSAVVPYLLKVNLPGEAIAMANKIMKLCISTSCFAALRQELFPAKTTRCPNCQALVQSVTVVSPANKGSTKGGGKSDTGKSISRSSSGPTLGATVRKKTVKKQPFKVGLIKDDPLKPLLRKRTPRKPPPRKR
jgi:hypothetical protein